MSSHVILSGSNREHPADAAFMGKPSPDEVLQITCILRRKDDAPKTPAGRLSHQQFERIQGADPAGYRQLSNSSRTNMVSLSFVAMCLRVPSRWLESFQRWQMRLGPMSICGA